MGAAGLVPMNPLADRAAEAAAVAHAAEFAEAGAANPGFAETLDTAPALLLVLADLAALATIDRDLPRYTFVGGASIYPFVWSLLLAARAEGLGGVTTTVAIRREAEVKALFAIPDTVAVAALVVLGRPVTQPRRLTRAPVSSFTWVDRYEGTSPGRFLTGAAERSARRATSTGWWLRAEMAHGPERARRRAPALQLQPADRLLPRRLLQHRRRGPRRPHRLHPGDGRVPGLLRLGRQRPLDPASRVRLRRAPTGRPVVPVRTALAGGLRGRDGASVVLEATHAATLEWVQLSDLVAHAVVGALTSPAMNGNPT